MKLSSRLSKGVFCVLLLVSSSSSAKIVLAGDFDFKAGVTRIINELTSLEECRGDPKYRDFVKAVNELKDSQKRTVFILPSSSISFAKPAPNSADAAFDGTGSDSGVFWNSTSYEDLEDPACPDGGHPDAGLVHELVHAVIWSQGKGSPWTAGPNVIRDDELLATNIENIYMRNHAGTGFCLRSLYGDVDLPAEARQSCCNASGLIGCDGECVDGQNDSNHCGSCSKKCETGSSCCRGACLELNTNGDCGMCGRMCTLNKGCCGKQCIDLGNDAQNCGACGKTCTGTMSCCNAGCIDTTSDPENCGSCANHCAAGQACTSTGCMCAAGEVLCGGTGCCAIGQCMNGTCVCKPGQTACGDRCVDIQNDRDNCGSCGRKCAKDTPAFHYFCARGTCLFECATGTVCLGGTQSTAFYGLECVRNVENASSPEVCNGGNGCFRGNGAMVCRHYETYFDNLPGWLDRGYFCNCPCGQILCSDHCVNVLSDPANCGTCNRGCPQNGLSECVQGECVAPAKV